MRPGNIENEVSTVFVKRIQDELQTSQRNKLFILFNLLTLPDSMNVNIEKKLAGQSSDKCSYIEKISCYTINSQIRKLFALRPTDHFCFRAD